MIIIIIIIIAARQKISVSFLLFLSYVFFLAHFCHCFWGSQRFWRPKWTIYLDLLLLNLLHKWYRKLCSRTFSLNNILLDFFSRCGVVCSLDFYNLAAMGWNSSYYFFSLLLLFSFLFLDLLAIVLYSSTFLLLASSCFLYFFASFRCVFTFLLYFLLLFSFLSFSFLILVITL